MLSPGGKIVLAHVTHNICYGGTELNIVKQINALDVQKFEPAIISISDQQGNAENLLSQNVRLFKVRKDPGFQNKIIIDLISIFKKLKPHIVYSHNWTTFFYTVLAAKWARVPIILHGEHGRDTASYESNWKRILACRILSRWCDRITAVSKDLIELVETTWSVPGWKIEYFPNGIDLQRFKPDINREAARRALGVASHKLLIGSIVGKVRPVKDLQTLLRAFSIVIRHRPEATLVLVGQGLDDPELQSVLSDHQLEDFVHLLPHRAHVQEVYPALDIYANTSLYEGMSNTILEAQACGVPVVATRVGGTPTIIRDGLNGLLVSPGKPEKVAEAILHLAGDEELRSQLAANARRYVEQNHDFKNVVRRFEAFYLELYKNRHQLKPAASKRVVRTIGRISHWKDNAPAIIIRENRPIFVINYHRVLPDTLAAEYLFAPMVTPESVFERQLKFFRKHCHVIGVQEAIELISRPDRSRFNKTVVLTFDDGYCDFIDYAAPALEAFELEAILFVVAESSRQREIMWFDRMSHFLCDGGLLEANGHEVFPECVSAEVETLASVTTEAERRLAARRIIHRLTYEPQERIEALMEQLENRLGKKNGRKNGIINEFLSWDDLRSVASRTLFTIGSHGLRHQRLNKLTVEDIQNEVAGSKEMLERNLGESIQFFSYPWGAYDDRVLKAVREAGYTAAFALGNVPCSRPKSLFEIPRIDSGLLKLDDKFDKYYMMGALSPTVSRLRRLKSYLGS